MANIHPDIRPAGMNQKELVKFLYAAVASYAGLCAKLDLDAGVPLTTYLANCYTAMFSDYIEDHQGNRTGLTGRNLIKPTGMSDKALLLLMYDLTNALETLTEQLDTDTLTGSDFEALCYTALIFHNVEDDKGNRLGNGTVYYFGPTSIGDNKQLIEWIYNYVNAWETLCEKLDADGTVTDTKYEELWYTATYLFRVENAAGSVLGNTRTDMA